MPVRSMLLILCLYAVLIGGCNSTPGGMRTSAGATMEWAYAPVDIRVHPLSRVKFNDTGDEARVEARIELLDQDGFSTRSLGDLKLVLSGSSEMGSHTQVEWECDLSTVAMNGKQYDCVTRTYLAHLQLVSRDDIPMEPVLYAQFQRPDGHSLSDRQPIRITAATQGSENLDN
jgi:2-keto-4-pentenoate hydratase/2-oxohepta-3-ene-1,7-dioic acid hydratase in catechol pathway